MSGKSTPRPWSAEERMFAGGRQLMIIGQHGQYTVPVASMMTGAGEIGWANARLIAAAPDLYEALQTLVTAKDMKTAGDDAVAYHVMKSLGWERARAALAKATGGDGA